MLSRSIRPGRPGAALAVLGVRGRLYGVCFWPFRPGDVWSAAGGGVGTVYAHLRRDQRDGGGVSGGRGLWDRGWGGGGYAGVRGAGSAVTCALLRWEMTRAGFSSRR